LLAGRSWRPAPGELTAKEQLLYDYLLAHAGRVCDRDELIRAVWPEDVVYEEGVRDDSLAQLVRRLRLKIEPEPAEPRFVETVPGRGYLYRPGRSGSPKTG
jgi:two-component system response regulator RegX3